MHLSSHHHLYALVGLGAAWGLWPHLSQPYGRKGSIREELARPALGRKGEEKPLFLCSLGARAAYQSVSTLSMTGQVPSCQAAGKPCILLSQAETKCTPPNDVSDAQTHNYMIFNLVRRHSLCQLLAILKKSHSQGESF